MTIESIDPAVTRFYQKYHWQPRWVKSVDGRKSIRIYYPPDERAVRADDPKPKPVHRVQGGPSDKPHTWLAMLTAWEHLKTGEKFTLARFLDAFFDNWTEAARILFLMASTDQSEVMKHFAIEGLHVGTRAIIQRARADYMAAQAAREPDPLAENG